MHLLEVTGLHAGYGDVRVLHGIDFHVEQGGVTALLGANGAGKTTTLRALSGMIRAQGSVTLAGTRLEGLRPEQVARHGVAHVPDDRGTILELSVDENLRLGAYTRSKAEAAADRERVLDYFPKLRQRTRQQAGTLSGGEQQMLAIGRALMLRPRLLLLDEPSSGLAPLIIRDIFDIMRRVRQDHGISVLLVEQNARLALDLADQACLLETGRIVASGPAADIAADEAVRRSYLGY